MIFSLATQYSHVYHNVLRPSPLTNSVASSLFVIRYYSNKYLHTYSIFPLFVNLTFKRLFYNNAWPQTFLDPCKHWVLSFFFSSLISKRGAIIKIFSTNTRMKISTNLFPHSISVHWFLKEVMLLIELPIGEAINWKRFQTWFGP